MNLGAYFNIFFKSAKVKFRIKSDLFLYSNCKHHFPELVN